MDVDLALIFRRFTLLIFSHHAFLSPYRFAPAALGRGLGGSPTHVGPALEEQDAVGWVGHATLGMSGEDPRSHHGVAPRIVDPKAHVGKLLKFLGDTRRRVFVRSLFSGFDQLMKCLLDKVGKGFLSEGRLHTPEVDGAKLELSGAAERDGFASEGLLFDLQDEAMLGLSLCLAQGCDHC